MLVTLISQLEVGISLSFAYSVYLMFFYLMEVLINPFFCISFIFWRYVLNLERSFLFRSYSHEYFLHTLSKILSPFTFSFIFLTD